MLPSSHRNQINQVNQWQEPQTARRTLQGQAAVGTVCVRKGSADMQIDIRNRDDPGSAV